MYIIMIIPMLKPMPVFDLIDPETDLEREMTPEEETQLAEYKIQEDNWTSLKSFCEALSIDGVYEKVIDRTAPIYLKDGMEYQVFCLDTDRLRGISDLDDFVFSQSQSLKTLWPSVYLGISISPAEWLEQNGFISNID